MLISATVNRHACNCMGGEENTRLVAELLQLPKDFPCRHYDVWRGDEESYFSLPPLQHRDKMGNFSSSTTVCFCSRTL